MIDTCFIEPIDVLALRGNKLFGDPGSFGESLVPPWPSVAAGAVRSWILARDGFDLQAFAAGREAHPVIGTPDSPGPFAVTAFHLGWRRDGRVESLFAPPADLVVTEDLHVGKATRMTPLVPADGVLSSAALPELAVLRQGARAKPAAGYWLTSEGWRAYLDGADIEPQCLVPSKDLWTTDVRVGVGLSVETRRADDGKLFTVSGVAFKRGVGFVLEVRGAELPDEAMLRFGGDGRSARLDRLSVAPIEPDLVAIHAAGRARIVLTTPGIFEQGWLPNGFASGPDGTLRIDLHGVRARLVCAAVPRPEVVSGFDIARWQPKPALRVAPTGSVYWVDQLESSPEALRKLVDDGLWTRPDQNPSRRVEGFNRLTLAVY